MCNRTGIEKKIDILVNGITSMDPILLKLLLEDKTTHENIMWCNKDYEYQSSFYDEHAQIFPSELSKGLFTNNVVQLRAAKSKAVQEQRIRKRAEVFTPSWICNEQNNQVDEAWFGRANVFNTPKGTSWITTTNKITFDGIKKTWKAYVGAKRLEITCGEAPYLISRYDAITGDLIPIHERIGLFDRKMRVVNENCENDEEWLKWSLRALKSVFGYELQGDNVLIARVNLLYDYMDYYGERFKQKPPINLLKKAANIISWNIWQMDGLKCVVPYSCHKKKLPKNLFEESDESKDEEKVTSCPGCEKNDIFNHKGTYCRIYDWTHLKSIQFIDVLKERNNYGKI